MNQNIWVIGGESYCDSDCSYQMLSKANSLSQETGGKTVAVWVGELKTEQASMLFQFGADKILNCKEDSSNTNEILLESAKHEKPGLILVPNSEKGCLCASAFSIGLGGGLVAECIEIQTDQKYGYVFMRAALSASVTAQIVCIQTEYSICTVKNNVFASIKVNPNAQIGEIEYCKFKVASTKKEPVIRESSLLENHEFLGDLKNSRVIFGFGRGIGGEANLNLLKKIAREYHAELVGSRAAVEAGLIIKERQVGQSGISISPDIYINFGISGANQHMVGVKNAGIIISINQDKNAPIFDYSDYRIVEDCGVVLKNMKQFLESEKNK